MIAKSDTAKKIFMGTGIGAVIGILLIVASQVMLRTDKWLGESAGWMTPVGVLVILTAVSTGGYLFYRFSKEWHAVSDAANSYLAEHGITVVLAPRSATMPEDKIFDLWRRMSIILERTGDVPGQHITWEIFGDRDRVAFLMRIPADWLRRISGELSREFPNLDINQLPTDATVKPAIGLFVDPPVMAVANKETMVWQELALARESGYPLFSSGNTQGQLLALLGAMSIVAPKARAGYQFQIRKAPSNTSQQFVATATKLMPKAKGGQPAPKVSPETRKLMQVIQERSQQPLFDVTVRCWASSADEALANAELARISQAIIAETIAAGPANQFIPGKNGKGYEPVIDRHFPAETKVQIPAPELGAFLHLPGKVTGKAFPKLVISMAKRLPPSPSLVVHDDNDLSSYRLIGTFEHPTGDVDTVGQPVMDTRKHTYAVGPTGTGKSVFMVNSIISDYMNEGAGVVMVEPSGDVPAELVAGLPPSALNSVVLLRPDDMQPFALNMCDIGIEDGVVIAAKNAINAIQMGMGANWATSVRMQQIMTNALYVVIDVLSRPDFGGPSLIALSKFLQNEVYREALLPHCSLQAMGAKEFWENDFNNWGEKQQTEAVSVALRRLSEWIGNPEIRRTLSMPVSTINLQHMLGSPLRDNTHPPKIVMLPLTNNDTKSLIGALFVGYFQTVIMGRHNIPKNLRRPGKLYIDEFADFVNTSGGDSIKILLAQARKFGAGVTLLTQGQGQIKRDVQVELDVNTLTKLFYTLGSASEAALASKQLMGAVDPYDMGKIPQYHTYLKVGNNSPALVKMYPPATYSGKQPALLKGFQTKPPKEWMKLIQATAPFNRFVKEMEVKVSNTAVNDMTAPDLLQWANKEMVGGDPDNLVRKIAALSDGDFAALETTRRQHDLWRAKEVEHNPSLIRDPLERVTWRSRWLYGVPWWLSDARFMRLLNKTTETSTPSSDNGGDGFGALGSMEFGSDGATNDNANGGDLFANWQS